MPISTYLPDVERLNKKFAFLLFMLIYLNASKKSTRINLFEFGGTSMAFGRQHRDMKDNASQC